MKRTVPPLLAALGFVALLPAIAHPAFAYTGQNLAHEAKISIDQARSIALKAHPGRSPIRSWSGKAAAAGFAIPSTSDADSHAGSRR